MKFVEKMQVAQLLGALGIEPQDGMNLPIFEYVGGQYSKYLIKFTAASILSPHRELERLQADQFEIWCHRQWPQVLCERQHGSYSFFLADELGKGVADVFEQFIGRENETDDDAEMESFLYEAELRVGLVVFELVTRARATKLHMPRARAAIEEAVKTAMERL